MTLIAHVLRNLCVKAKLLGIKCRFIENEFFKTNILKFEKVIIILRIACDTIDGTIPVEKLRNHIKRFLKSK